MKSRNTIQYSTKKQSIFKRSDPLAIKETFNKFDCTIFKKEESQICQSYTHTVAVGVKCPHCGLIGDDIPHGCSRLCDCGLKMTVYGNALECILYKDTNYAIKDKS